MRTSALNTKKQHSKQDLLWIFILLCTSSFIANLVLNVCSFLLRTYVHPSHWKQILFWRQGWFIANLVLKTDRPIRPGLDASVRSIKRKNIKRQNMQLRSKAFLVLYHFKTSKVVSYVLNLRSKTWNPNRLMFLIAKQLNNENHDRRSSQISHF